MASAQTWPREKLLWKKYNESQGKPEAQVESLIHLMKYYYKGMGDTQKGDSVTVLCLDIANSHRDNDLILAAYEMYFKFGARVSDRSTVDGYIESVKNLEPVPIWHLNYFASTAYFIDWEFTKAQEYALKSVEIAKSENDVRKQILGLMMVGSSLEKNRKIVEAMRYFFEAQNLLPEKGLLDLRTQIYSYIQRAYFYNDNFTESRKYIERQLEVYGQMEEVDSIEWLNTQYQLLELNIFTSDFYAYQDSAIALMKYSKANGYLQEYDNFWSIIRSQLMMNNDFKRIYELYVVEYPNEFKMLKKMRPLAYERIKAYLFEYEQNLDSADYQWRKVIQTLESTEDLYRISHVKRRYAQYLQRNGRNAEAYAMAQEALEDSKKANYSDFMAYNLKMLADMDEVDENYKQALAYTKLHDSIMIDKILRSQSTDLAVLDQKTEYEQKEKIRQFEEERKRTQTFYNYMALIASLFVFIVVSSIVYRQYRLTRKEKERSENLLLNILPQETAEELKEKGTTSAKKFDNVTVFFCDIVSFTKIAEKLSPEELVKEIDTYFREFDEIMKRHDLEKIKTIGDAYMAAGGLHSGDDDSALNVTRAAFDVLDKIEELREVREQSNRPAFQVRVGINTGAVVAGVVGSTKFQYDIWGDAVNTAARMEQNSEPGKINASKSTYERIKNEFNCTYRGYKEAKNKGEIEMYFVDKT
ncbi:MAG: adenylate/guanylate cyclase domain-containing protein [Schleiferiaceae bacterium]|jgi:class 3 adenylate cyclase|nr:adenylate/guanylate cyclase domain-containing protein [Schleiferiaceae bacterium]